MGPLGEPVFVGHVMDPDDINFCGKYPLQIETFVIKADPESVKRVKHWRVWRFNSYDPWYRRLFTAVYYFTWWWCYVIRHLHRPFVIKEIF